MKICTLSSGSSGNSIFIQTNEAKILVDCGLTGRMACELLKEIGVNPEELDAIFVTHEHIDHIKGVGVMSRKFDIPILANEKTWLSMTRTIGNIDPKNIIIFKSNSFFTYKDMDVQNISTYHDASDPVFFMFYQGKKKISILTDTGVVNQLMVDSIKGSDIILLESNHDVTMLEEGPYPIELKYRILSEHGHLSNNAASEIVKEIARGNGEILLLGHLSKTNNTPKVAFSNMKQTIEDMGFTLGKDIYLEVANEFQVGKMFEIRNKI